MKKWIKQTIKYILLAMFVAGMLYFNIKDHAAEIFDTLQHLQLRYTLGLILLSASVYVIGGIGICVLCRKVNPAYQMKSGISNAMISLFLMNVSASAVAKAAGTYHGSRAAVFSSWIRFCIKYPIWRSVHVLFSSAVIF